MNEVTVKLPAMHAGQVRVYQSRKRFNTVQCGRRWGKSTFGEIIGSETAIDGWCVGWFAPTYKYLEEVWREMCRDLRPIIKTANSQQKRIELITGGVIEFWTMDSPDPGRSRKYKRVIIDEAGIVKDLLEIWRSSIRATLADDKGDAWFLGTPKGRREFHTLFAKGESGEEDWASFRMPTVSNPKIDPKEVEAARRDLPEHIFRQEFEGIPADDGGNPFGMSAIAECFARTYTPGPTICYGIDVARSHDWCVMIGKDEQGRESYFDRWQGPWRETKKRILAALDAPCQVDQTGNGSQLVEELQAEAAHEVEGFTFTQQSKQRIMEGLACSIQSGNQLYRTIVLRNELENFEYEYTKTGVRYTAPSGLHDDAVCAEALCNDKWSRMARGPLPFIYQASGTSKTPYDPASIEARRNDEAMWTTVVGDDDNGW